MLNIRKLQKILSHPAKIVLIGHVNPDGDAVGALLAWGAYLERLGHTPALIVPNEPPAFLHSMPGYERLSCFKENPAGMEARIAEAEVIFAMDFNDLKTRIGAVAPYVEANGSAVRVLIDHHLDPPLEQYDLSFSDISASSTCLIVYRMIEALGGLEGLGREAAEAIYTGMMTDTGNFSYGNLNGELYRIIADLVDKGVSPVEVNARIYNVQSENRMRLVGYALYEKMVLPAPGVAYITLSIAELNRFRYRPGDTEGLVNMPLSIAGVVFSALFVETGECIKISLRSRGAEPVDANIFARTHFVGGGHKNAAGAKSFTSMAEAVRKFLQGVRELG